MDKLIYFDVNKIKMKYVFEAKYIFLSRVILIFVIFIGPLLIFCYYFKYLITVAKICLKNMCRLRIFLKGWREGREEEKEKDSVKLH